MVGRRQKRVLQASWRGNIGGTGGKAGAITQPICSSSSSEPRRPSSRSFVPVHRREGPARRRCIIQSRVFGEEERRGTPSTVGGCAGRCMRERHLRPALLTASSAHLPLFDKNSD